MGGVNKVSPSHNEGSETDWKFKVARTYSVPGTIQSETETPFQSSPERPSYIHHLSELVRQKGERGVRGIDDLPKNLHS